MGDLHCRKCRKKKNILEWHQVFGMLLVEEFEGKPCYRVKCPDCGEYQVPVWNVEKWKVNGKMIKDIKREGF